MVLNQLPIEDMDGLTIRNSLLLNEGEAKREKRTVRRATITENPVDAGERLARLYCQYEDTVLRNARNAFSDIEESVPSFCRPWWRFW